MRSAGARGVECNEVFRLTIRVNRLTLAAERFDGTFRLFGNFSTNYDIVLNHPLLVCRYWKLLPEPSAIDSRFC